MNLKTISCILAAAIATPFVAAQPSETISLQFLSFPQQENLKPIELLIEDNKTIPIEIPGHELSPVYKVKGLTSIAVGAMTKNADNDPVFKVYGKAPALSSARQIVLLLRKGPSNEDGFTVLPLDGNLQEFTGGGYYFINASRLAVSGKIGDKTFALQPGQKSLLRPAATHEVGGCQATFAYQKQDKWKKFYDTRWSVNRAYRVLVFFYQDPESGSLGIAPIMELL